MKVFDSGMPDETYWNSLFDVPEIVDWLDLKNIIPPVVEVGCGYGTFTVPVARRVEGNVIAIDIEPGMIEMARKNLENAGCKNVQLLVRDVVNGGTGLESGSVGLVLLFNILHSDERGLILNEASRILRPGGVAAVIHWRKDIETPRGPSMATRPDEAMIHKNTERLDLHVGGNSRVLKPYHWGMQLIKDKAH